MIKSEIRVHEEFDRVTAAVKAKTRYALEHAAREGKSVADAAQGSISSRGSFKVIPVHGTESGFESGIKGNPLVRIFDKGTLGKRKSAPERPRKDTWKVKRKGTEYTAHRGDVEGKGIAPRNILAPAQRAGRKALISFIRR